VFYWPTETQSPPVSTIINEAGFTLYVFSVIARSTVPSDNIILLVSLHQFMLALNL
jgi:hypothetical protein